jgi:hypothetical protein
MAMGDEIAARVERFVAEMKAAVARAARSAVEEAFAGLGGGEARASVAAPTPAPARAARPQPAPKQARRGARAAAVRTPAPLPAAAAPRPPSPRPRGKAVAAPQASPGVVPGAARAPQPVAEDSHTAPVTEREERVLAAVADLVCATAADVVEHSGLPNGSVTVALRALVARGRLSRRETSSGVEYTLPARAATT